MARNQDAREQTLAIAKLALEAQGAPLHYLELTELMQTTGWTYLGKGQPAHHVYAVVYQDLKDWPDQTPFQFFRRGVFGLKGMELTLDERRETRRQARGLQPTVSATRSQLPRLCGCCHSMQYQGIKEATLDSGLCERYAESGRPYNRTEAEACPLWRPRPLGQMRAEVERQHELFEFVGIFNAKFQGGRRYHRG